MANFTDIKYISGFNSWQDMLFSDKRTILATMARNMAADLDNGYDFFGTSIQRQIREMTVYANSIEALESEFNAMPEERRERYAFNLLKKSGAIE